jgi:S1-C subfamily serine protease
MTPAASSARHRIAAVGIVWLACAAPAAAQDDFPGVDRRVTPEVLVVREAAPAVVYIEAHRPIAVQFRGGEFRQQLQAVTGSGVVVEKSGYVITNFHVVGNDHHRITVQFDPEIDDTLYEAEFVSGVPKEDLALLRIRAQREFPVVRRGTSADLMIGERVIAIGNPFRQRLSVSSGIISGLHRNVTIANGFEFTNLIQTDAAINMGNSGGPLLNILGELVGINTAVNQGAENMGFAIPVDRVEEVLRDYLLVPSAARSWIGLEVDEERGFEVCDLTPEGPADAAGVEAGYRLVAMDGRDLESSEDYRLRRLKLEPNQAARFTFLLPDGQRREVELVGWDKVDGLIFQRLGLVLEPWRQPGYQRVKVARVSLGGPAGALGLAPGDVLDSLRVAGGMGTWSVSTPEGLASLLSGLSPGTKLTLDVLRDEDQSGRFERDEIFRGELALR